MLVSFSAELVWSEGQAPEFVVICHRQASVWSHLRLAKLEQAVV